jgi:hypothetical protein
MSLNEHEKKLMAISSLQEMSDTTWECPHGRMWWDRTPACGCWGELEGRPQPFTKEARDNARRGYTTR